MTWTGDADIDLVVEEPTGTPARLPLLEHARVAH